MVNLFTHSIVPRQLLTNLHANPYGGSVSQRILGAHYTQIRTSLKARGAILIAERSRPRGFFDQSRRGRPGGGISRGLVEASAVGQNGNRPAHSAAAARRLPAAGPPTVVMQSFADAVARAAPAVVNIYTARVVTERTQSPSLNQLFGDFWPSYRQRVERSLGSGVIVDAARHHRDQSARHRRCGFHPRAARRRPHRRCHHRRPGSRYGPRHSASGHRQAARHAAWAARTLCGSAISCWRSAIPTA